MSQQTPPPEARRTAILRSPALQAGAEAAAFAMMAFAAAGWMVSAERAEIAAGIAEDYLRGQGVEADIQVERVDARAFVGSIRAGPRANPVFTAERVEVAYDLTAPWAGGGFDVTPRAIRLVKPRLRVSFDGRKFSAGQLDPLISDFLARPKTKEPGPAVLIQQSLTTVATKNGDVRVSGDAALDDGQLLRFDGKLLPTTLKGTDFNIASSGGAIHLRKTGASLAADLRLKVEDLTTGGVSLDGGEAAIEGVVPYPDPDSQALAGPARLRAAVYANRARAGELEGTAFGASALLDGGLAGSPATATFAGKLNGRAHAAALSAGEAKMRGVNLALDGRDVKLGRKASAFPFATRLEAAGLNASGFDVRNAAINASGRFNADTEGYAITAHGTGVADSGLPAARAPDIAGRIPVLSGDPGQARAIEQALRRFHAHARDIDFSLRNGEVKLALSGPVQFDAASGGQARLTPHGPFSLIGGKPGGFDLAVHGGGLPSLDASVSSWSYAKSGLDARVALTGAFEAPPAQGAKIDVAGVLRTRGARTTFALTKCGEVSARVVDFGETDVTDASARLCPGDTPLVTADNGGWRVAGRFENAALAIPVWTVKGTGAAGRFAVAGRGDMDSADVNIAAIRISDTADETRFNPVRASGRAQLAAGVWRGAFPVTSDAGYPVADIALTHDVASGRGEARIDASHLMFAKEGLQPGALSPLGEIARDAEGPAAFTGVLSWGPDGVASSGELSTTGLNFRSPAGQVSGLRTRIVFTSLAPLISEPDQKMTVDKLAAIIPLTDAKVTFDLVEDAATVDAATATVADGEVTLEPMTLPLGKSPTVKGVLNLSRINIGSLVADTSLADRIKVDAVVDGRLPFELGPDGLRFFAGQLHAVQPGRISISREVLSNVDTGGEPANPMDATQPTQQVNAVQDFAYQAMENLSFETLEASLNSTDNGRLNVIFTIHGHHDPKVAEEARISIQDALAGNAFNKHIPLPKGTPVNLTLDTSLNFAELLAAWRRGWKDAAEP
ncbi:MAG TPA: YdbH domain-containing protein [Caulobacteraceae bacterium]